MESPLTPKSLNRMSKADSGDVNPRPMKRMRISEETHPVTEHKPLPPSQLLLSLPSLLHHPPAHKFHRQALDLSRLALKTFLEDTSNLDKDSECRAWTELAELGFRIGLDVEGVEADVEKGITKALLIARKHPSLRTTIPSLTALSARLSIYRGSPKVAQTALKNLISNFLLPSDEPGLVYRVWLAYISSLCSASSSSAYGGTASGSLGITNAKALSALHDFRALATENGHDDIATLVLVMEVKECMDQGMWTRTGELLVDAEKELNLELETELSASTPDLPATATTPTNHAKSPLQTLLSTLVLLYGTLFHTYAGSNGSSQVRMKRLHEILDKGALDAFGDDGVIRVPVPPARNAPPSRLGPTVYLELQAPHPRHIFTISFLVSALSKRDPVGRKPKRRVFANEGALAVERDVRKEISFPRWASEKDVQDWKRRMERVRADMLCELVGVAIQRSEFDEADKHLAALTSHVLTHSLFSLYSARISLHHAHLAHAQGGCDEMSDRAARCYELAAWLSRSEEDRKKERLRREKELRQAQKTPRRKGDVDARCSLDSPEETQEVDGFPDLWVHTAAKAGSLWLRIGLLAAALPSTSSSLSSPPPSSQEQHSSPSSASESAAMEAYDKAMEEVRGEAKDTIKSCRTLGGTLHAIGEVLEACLAKEYLSVKSHLRTALTLSTAALDNHLRALVLSLVAAQYMHTAGDHASTMLSTAEGLAAGLGASEMKNDKVKTRKAQGKPGGKENTDNVGNAHLRSWIGERCLELKRRAGDDEAVAAQLALNQKFEQAVEKVKSRGSKSRKT